MFILCWCSYISQDVVAVSWTLIYILFDSYVRVSNFSESTDVIELAPFVLLVFFPIRVVDRCRMKKCYSCVSLLVIKSRGTLTALYLYISAAASRYMYTYIFIYMHTINSCWKSSVFFYIPIYNYPHQHGWRFVCRGSRTFIHINIDVDDTCARAYTFHI